MVPAAATAATHIHTVVTQSVGNWLFVEPKFRPEDAGTAEGSRPVDDPAHARQRAPGRIVTVMSWQRTSNAHDPSVPPSATDKKAFARAREKAQGEETCRNAKGTHMATW